jgi:hypothetical protein
VFAWCSRASGFFGRWREGVDLVMLATHLELVVVGQHGVDLASGAQLDRGGEVDRVEASDLGGVDLGSRFQPRLGDRPQIDPGEQLRGFGCQVVQLGETPDLDREQRA